MGKVTYEVKRIGVFSAVKTLFLLGGFSGFVLGVLQWMMMRFIWWVGMSSPIEPGIFSQPGMEEIYGSALGTLGLFFPIFGAIAGAGTGVIAGFLLTGLYNLGARIWGGLEVRLETSAASADELPIASARPGEATPLPRQNQPGTPDAPPPPPKPDDDDDSPPSRPSAAMFE